MNTNKKYWINDKIKTHWSFIGCKTKVIVTRNYLDKTILIDFMNGGSCTLYTYNGKWIAG